MKLFFILNCLFQLSFVKVRFKNISSLKSFENNFSLKRMSIHSTDFNKTKCK